MPQLLLAFAWHQVAGWNQRLVGVSPFQPVNGPSAQRSQGRHPPPRLEKVPQPLQRSQPRPAQDLAVAHLQSLDRQISPVGDHRPRPRPASERRAPPEVLCRQSARLAATGLPPELMPALLSQPFQQSEVGSLDRQLQVPAWPASRQSPSVAPQRCSYHCSANHSMQRRCLHLSHQPSCC